MPTKLQIDVICRWMIRRDLQEILPIEAESFEIPWTSNDFIEELKQKSSIGLVAERNEVIHGYVLYRLQKEVVMITNLAVAVVSRRREVGMQMIDKLKTKLVHQRRKAIVAYVRETNLAAQLFFREVGFRATGVIPEYYEESGEDAYEFVFKKSDCEED